MKGNLRRLLTFFLVLMLLSANICAIAEAAATLTLPSALQIIEEEAFYGNTSIEKIVVPAGTTEIRGRAFADSSMTELVLPDTLTLIAEDAFEGCGEFALTVPENCYAYDRCVELGLIKPDPPVIESAHPYPDDFDYTWTYDADEGTETVAIMFSADTETEEDCDYIYLYTLDDVLVGKYSGTELANQSVIIDGAGFKLRLTSDEIWEGSNTYYGFKLDSIVPKKAVPLTFESITAESNTVAAGENIRWTVATTGGKAPVFYDYTVLLGEEEVATGTAEAPSAIEYASVRAGEYRLSVIARDSADVVLPAQVSDAVTVAPSTAYPESEHPYAANTDQSWVYAAEENVESLTVTFSGDTETQSGYDYIYLYAQDGSQIGKYSGTELAGQSVVINGTAVTIRLTSNGSTQSYGFAITDIEKYIPGPLTFVSLTANKTKAKVGDLITWTMETEGGRSPVVYEYTITRNGEIMDSGSVVRPESIEYVPMAAGDYTLSVVAKDAEGALSPAQISAVRIAGREDTAAECFTYETINGLYSRITGYTGTDSVVLVPEMTGDYTVQEIGDGAFCDNGTLVSVLLPDTVTTVGPNAFRNCDALKAIDFGQGITNIGYSAFYDCDALKTFTFPDSVTTTGGNVLCHCDNLTDVRFPNGWTSAGDSTVAQCPRLKRIELPEGLTIVPAYAFRYCTNLEEVVLPSSMLTIGECAFGDCTGFKQIAFNDGLETISNFAFENCTELTSIAIPDSVTFLSGFNGCSNLTKIEFNNGLNAIGRSAFENCINLKAAILPDSVTGIGNKAFKGCTALSEFRYPAGWKEVLGCGFTPEGYIFENCPSLTGITIPEGVTAIPGLAFRGASYVRTFDLPGTLQTIGVLAFEGCKGITTMLYPESLQSIERSAFENCEYLKAAILPDSVTGIGNKAFKGCTALSEFRYPTGWKEVLGCGFIPEGYIFENCPSLTGITIPEGVTAIPHLAFRGANYVRTVDLPSTLQTIGDLAFEGCSSLEKIYIPTSVTAIGDNSFANCPILTIWTEYGAYALQYAINNGIAYYYLTPDGANIPSGTLYRGDDYPLYGYARASVNLTNVTATIWDSTGSTALQSVSIAPGITDYSLGGEISASLDFASLPLGTYRYTLRASTGISEELWADSTFRIVPPPLRVSRIGLNIPYGFYGEEDVIPVSGTITANYPISRIDVGVYDDNDAPTAQAYIGFPSRTTFELSEAGLSVGALPSGSYVFKVIVTGNGETITAVCSDFTLSGVPSIDVGSVDRDALSAFLENSDNSRPFENVNYYGSLEYSLTELERLKYGMYTSDKKVRSDLIDLFLNGMGINDCRRSEYLVTLYKEEITSYVKTQMLILGNLKFDELDREKTVTSFVDLHKLSWEQIKADLGPAASAYEKAYVEAVNDCLKDVDWTITTAQQLRDLAGYFYDALQDYTQGIQILDALSAEVLVPANWNYNYQLAVRELKDEYTSNSTRLVRNLFKYAMDECAKEGHKKIVECAIKGLAGGEVYIAYKITKAAWTIFTEETGFYDDVAKLDKYRAQVETFGAAYQNYTECFNAIRNGTSSDATVARLIQYFELTKAAGIRSIETLRTLPMHSRFVSDGELLRLTNEFQRKHCP